MDNMPNVNIYIETSIRSPNSRKGAGMYIIEYGLKKSSGTATCNGILVKENTTMDGLAAQTLLAALSRMIKPCSNKVFTSYAAKFEKRIKDMQIWKENGWKTARGKPPKNLEDWKELDTAMQIHKIDFTEEIEAAENEEGSGWKSWILYTVKKSVREYVAGRIYYPVDKQKVSITNFDQGYLMTWKDTNENA